MHKRGNEDTCIKEKSGGREDGDWEQGQGRCQGDEFTVLKKNTENWNKIRSEYPWQAILIVLSVLVLHLKHSFLLPTPRSSEQRPSPQLAQKNIYRNLKNRRHFFSLCLLWKETCLLPFQAQRESWSVRLIHLPRLSSQASLPIVTVQAGKLLLASPAQLMRHEVPVGKGFTRDAMTVTSPNGSVSHLLCAITFPGHKSMWNVCWVQKPLRLQSR